MKTIKEKHSLMMRWTHWINFPILTVMIWSGLLIYWASDTYEISVADVTLFHFFPDSFYTYFNIPSRLAEGMAFHFLFMWFFAINGFCYMAYTIFSGAWRSLLPNRRSFKEAWLVLLYDLKISKILPPQQKYNAAQRIAYTGIILMGVGSLISGLAIFKPVQFYYLTWLCGGYHFARIIHFALTIGYVFFFMIHIVQVVLSGWQNFKAVITGFIVMIHEPETDVQHALPEDGRLRNKDEVFTEKRNIFKWTQNVPKIEQQINRRTFISFTSFFAAGGAMVIGWKWLYESPLEVPGITANAQLPLRRALNKTELFFNNFYSNAHLVKTYPKEMAEREVRVNSNIGIDDDGFDLNSWHLRIKRLNKETLIVSMEQIKSIPKTEIIYSFKCVEGWDQIQHWAGVRLSDFLVHCGLEEEARLSYMGLETPNGEYYVGLEMESALHPQTILAYEMNDEPIALKHGAPLRLIVPVKYGIKNLKRIGTMSFSSNRPRDFWAEQGYDYYSGL